MIELELFSHDACPYAQRTRMALIEKGVPFRLTEIDLRNKPAWFKDISPYGKVPALRHGEAVIHESRVINEYLDEIIPVPALMPPDAQSRAEARIWIDYCDTYFVPTLHALIGDRAAPEKQAKNRRTLRERLLFIEHGLKALSPGPFWFGPEVGLVDLHFMPFFERFPTYGEMWDVPMPSQCTRLQSWIAAMKGRESYRQTAHTHEFHMQRLRQYAQAA